MKKHTREFNSIRNFTVALINQFLVLSLGLISKNIFLHTLGTTFLGLNGLFSNILLLSFAEFGIGSVMAFNLYSPLSRGDKREIATTYNFFKAVYRTLSLVVLLVGIVGIPFLPLVVNLKSGVDVGSIKTYYMVYITGVVISNMFMYKSHMILADQKNYVLSLFNIFFENGTSIIQIIILITTRNYYLYLLAFIGKNIAYSLATTIKVKKLYPYLEDKSFIGNINEKDKKSIYRRMKDVFGYRIARLFITGTDNILISIISGTVWVGYYSNYDLIILGVTGLISTFYDGISASVGDLMAREKREDQYSMFETIQLLNIWITGFTVTCLFILFQDFIALWLGDAYVIDFKIVILIIVNYFLVCNRKPIIIFREAAGMFNKIKNAMFLAAFLNILVSVIAGNYIGIYGILIGTIVASLTTYYWYEPMILIKDNFNMSVKPFLKLQMENVLYTSISIILTSVFVMWIREVSLINFSLKLLICLVVPNIFYIFVLSRKKRFSGVMRILTRYTKKLRKRS